MKIKKIELENFKSAPNGCIELDKVNVLIGENGRGKTSIQNAFRYLLNGSLPPDPIRHGTDHMYVSAEFDDGQNTTMERVLYPSESRQINGIEFKEKDFLNEVQKFHQICLRDHSALTVKKRSNPYFNGKADDILWEFLLNGKVDGSRMYGLKELEVELEDGTNLYLCRSQASKAMINGKKVTGKVYTEFLQSQMNGDVKSLDIVTSSEVMSAMEMSDFAKYLISIVPVTIDFAKMSELAKLTKEEEDILRPLFPAAPNPITTADIAAAYKTLYSARSEIKRQMNTQIAKSIYRGSLPLMEKAKIHQALDEMNQKKGAAKQIIQAWKVYEQRCADRKKIIESIQNKIQEFNKLGHIEPPDEKQFNEIQMKKKQLQESIEISLSNVSRLKQSNFPLQNMVSNLNTTICPLCDKLVCNTDKTACKQDLENIINNNIQIILNTENMIAQNRDLLARVHRAELAFMNQRELYAKKYTLYTSIESMKKNVPEQPQPPQPMPDLTFLEADIKKHEHYFDEITRYEECVNAQKLYMSYKKQHELYNGLVRKTEPKKGLLTNTVLGYILTPFTGHVNSFAGSVFGDMEIAFRMGDEGLQVYCRPHGRTQLTPVKALSTGERMLVMFALMDMIASVSNTRILAFDSLESLDKTALENLFRTLVKQEVQNRYDHIILSLVGHDSIRKVLDNFKTYFNVIEVR